MYSTCLYCYRDLGSNESVEAFPVGRKLAFDAAKGRLWAVCASCGRWNLAPLEERWEAIEQCERRFRDTRIRASTDNIGLAKLREGTELVRIGESLRPEFAAWRYTNHIVRRRRRALATGAVVTTGIAATAFGLSAGLGAGGSTISLYQILNGMRNRLRDRRLVARLDGDTGQILVRSGSLRRIRWRPPVAGRPFTIDWLDSDPGPNSAVSFASQAHRPLVSLEGPDAIHFAGVALANLNRTTGSAAEITGAVDWIEAVGNPFSESAPEVIRELERDRKRSQDLPIDTFLMHRDPVMLGTLPEFLRFGLEMAAHEAEERLFLSAHLSVLEQAWKEAEEIASIADDLLLPDWIRARFPG